MATYIIQAGHVGPVKIGKTDDVEHRLAALQTAHHETLHVIRIVDTHFDSEGAFHDRFAAYRIRGEWFDFVDEMLTFIPSPPAPLLSVGDVVKNAKRAAVDEVGELIDEIWLSFKEIDTRGRFVYRIGKMLQVKPSRARKLVYRITPRVDVHEIEGLRAIARKLRSEASEPRKIDRPLPLFAGLDGR